MVVEGLLFTHVFIIILSWIIYNTLFTNLTILSDLQVKYEENTLLGREWPHTESCCEIILLAPEVRVLGFLFLNFYQKALLLFNSLVNLAAKIGTQT